MMKSLAMLLAALIALGAPPGRAQPAGTNPNPPGGPVADPGSDLPALKRLEIRQDTPEEREAFLARRRQQMQGQRPEQVAPLPAQQIAPSSVKPAR